MKAFFTISFFCVLITNTVFGQDTLRLSNGDYITGEIKELKRNVIKIDPSYGENIFQLDWDDVTSVKSDRLFCCIVV